jgi:6-pyruvoyltetrahydropterin/6-carboxytetrahydropterin synthase
MKAYLGRRYKFSASHRLFCASLSEAENQRVYGKCANPHGHGHNYTVEVMVGGELNPVTGMVCDLTELDGTVGREVLEPFACRPRRICCWRLKSDCGGRCRG